jgi:hypothetical protein
MIAADATTFTFMIPGYVIYGSIGVVICLIFFFVSRK